MSTEQTLEDGGGALLITDTAELRTELAMGEPVAEEETVDPALDAQAVDIVDKLFQLNPKEMQQAQDGKAAVEGLALEVQKSAAKRSVMLKKPIHQLSERGEDGGPVANALVELNMQVEELDPAKFDLEPGFVTRLLGYLPFIGSPLKRYFKQYESAQTVIDAIIRSLREGQATLKRDNITLQQDQQAMGELTQKLVKAIKLGQLIDKKLSYKLEREVAATDPRFKFISEELLFPLRQRIQDLQQHLVVMQQAVLSIELIIRNNKELVRGVNRAVNVTVSALETAVTLSLALANQRIVLDKVTAVNETTNSLIAGSAERLRTQGAEIHKQAASTQLDMEVLKQAYTNIHAALDDISSFRRETLPKMAATILELDELTDKQAQEIEKMDQGGKVSSSLEIEIN